MDILETDAYDRRQRRHSSSVKSGPVLSLAALVLVYNGGKTFWGVAAGLVFSACGDCCLIWPELFLHGMAAFGVAHLLYSLSFLSDRYTSLSSSTTALFMSVILWLAGAGVYFYLLPFLQKRPDSAVLVPSTGVYLVLIIAMATLAMHTKRPLTVLGGLSFIISDLALSLQVFKVIDPLENGRAIIMTTYYLAQLLIALGDIKAGSDWEGDRLGKMKRM
ncbi:hypothetical protein MATL_G00214660 [Megalops atlanticus]|uniref:lysoplasmalogenase n=1 Tax=Megalops atlanticus TaxID=7932 RepID=A0A9D3PGX9_MEGAT|nr:hypothetical protein MATL_G00214660 [Megalops atlanticus]